MMQVIETEDEDIRLDEDGQPVADTDGDAAVVSDDACWLQDLKNEALTEEGELFYEDEDDAGSYGFGLLDFFQAEYDDFTELEIQQRIRSKMQKRRYIDVGSIQADVQYDGHTYRVKVTFKKIDEDREYSLNIVSDGVEVTVE